MFYISKTEGVIFSLAPSFLILPLGKKITRTHHSPYRAIHGGTNTAVRPAGTGAWWGQQHARPTPAAAGRHKGTQRAEVRDGEADGGGSQ